ncbi:MAG: hypothetical protein D6709_01135 [Chloroflexi bacterium]|jgi:hypothetical protein|uniref:Effector-associated domain-containing protein n=1 Tax=Candidatus Thermofonsia Clade 3 bacterium TaxID=2364212 RepID=A0A2M8QC63_9CHLR|nr:hypothetical protein [Candidatus Roseilinea sp. NK_OTU-006]PJF47370.1 MAG: hypothetical protein CUN48_08980 [Candidatus Thermofonsia Clade 3 bacterium]RMG65939.1 MAG: hypothetical protein D6709_01135 [Chloroflexota bacterium]
MNDQILPKLRELLLNEFSEPELIALCKEIGLDYEALPGTGAFGKTREILAAARAQDKLRMLQNRLRELKPEAYAISIGAAVTPAEAQADSPAHSERGTKAGSPAPRTILPLLMLLALVIGASLIFPTLSGNPASQAAPQAVPEVTSTSRPQPTLAASAPTVQPETIAAMATPADSPSATADGFQTAPAEMPETDSSTMATSTALPTPEPTALPTPEPTPTPLPSPTATDALSAEEAHPAAMTIRQINDQLLLFYSGKASAEDLEYFWTSKALKTVVDFGNIRLPRAMRIAPNRRDALEIKHEYLRAPRIISETESSAVVASREFWHYANSLNRNEVCEVRDYIYDMVRDEERYRVRSIQSRLVRSGCES